MPPRANTEHRQEARPKTLLGAKIIINKGQSTVDCLVRDLSSTGARLALSGVITVPGSFDLVVPQKDISRGVRVVWRRANEMGVWFEREQSSRKAPSSGNEVALRGRIRELEIEVQRLQSRIRDLTEGR